MFEQYKNDPVIRPENDIQAVLALDEIAKSYEDSVTPSHVVAEEAKKEGVEYLGELIWILSIPVQAIIVGVVFFAFLDATIGEAIGLAFTTIFGNIVFGCIMSPSGDCGSREGF